MINRIQQMIHKATAPPKVTLLDLHQDDIYIVFSDVDLMITTAFTILKLTLSYYLFRTLLLYLLITIAPDSNVLKLLSLLFPKISRQYKIQSYYTTNFNKTTSPSQTKGTPQYRRLPSLSKRKSIFMTPVPSRKATVISEDSAPQPPIRLLPVFESPLDPQIFVLLSLLSSLPKSPLTGVQPLPYLRPLCHALICVRVALPLFSTSSELVHDLFHIAGIPDAERVSNYLILDRFVKFVLFVACAGIVLHILGFDAYSSRIFTGFGFGSLLVGWGLQQALLDVVSGLCISFDHTYAIGDKLEVFGKQGDILEMGLRSIKIKLVRDGETLVVPNSVMMKEKVYTYKGWDERRCMIDFDVDLDTDYDLIKDLPREIVEECAREVEFCKIRPSSPGCYLLSITDSAYRFEVVYYIEEYGDDIEKYKMSLSQYNFAILKHLKEKGIRLAKRQVQLPNNA